MNTSIRILSVSVLGTVLLAANQAKATVIVDDLVTTSAGVTAGDVEGVKNAPDNSYSQGFAAGAGGYVDSITMDLGAVGTKTGGPTNPTGADTMSIYLYAANSSGVPTGSSALATIVSNLTEGEIEGTTSDSSVSVDSLGWSTGNNSSFIYLDTISFSSYDLVSGDDYAIVVEISDGTGAGQGDNAVGWGETSSAGTGQLGQTQNDPDGTDPYATLELTTSLDPVPDSTSTVLLLGAVLTGIGLVRRKLA